VCDAECLLAQFRAIFGEAGGERLPGNVGDDHTIPQACDGLMALPDPLLHGYFQAWDTQDGHFEGPHGVPVCGRRPHDVEVHLALTHMWEAAWALAQLHYDQVLKEEARTRSRICKSHPLCNLALVGQVINSASLTRHYAYLSSFADVCEGNAPDKGGLVRRHS